MLDVGNGMLYGRLTRAGETHDGTAAPHDRHADNQEDETAQESGRITAASPAS